MRGGWNKGKKLSEEHRMKVAIASKPRHFKTGHTINIGRRPWNFGLGTANLNHKIRSLGLFKKWRAAVIKKCGRICGCCGGLENLEVNHKIPLFDLIIFYNIKTVEDAKNCVFLWNTENGEVLCKKCHERPGKPRSLLTVLMK